nr:unnamed protein product [Callosobruchus analis]
MSYVKSKLAVSNEEVMNGRSLVPIVITQRHVAEDEIVDHLTETANYAGMKVSWVTDDRLRFFKNAFNLENDLKNANQEEDHSDNVEEKALVVLSDAEVNDLKI